MFCRSFSKKCLKKSIFSCFGYFRQLDILFLSDNIVWVGIRLLSDILALFPEKKLKIRFGDIDMIKKFIIILFGLSLYGSAHAASSSYASSSSGNAAGQDARIMVTHDYISLKELCNPRLEESYRSGEHLEFLVDYRSPNGICIHKDKSIQELGEVHYVCPPLVESIPEDIDIYREQPKKKSHGLLLSTVEDYFRLFPNLGFLAVKDPIAVMNCCWPNRASTLENVKLGNIPPFRAQCMRSKKSESLLNCLIPWGLSPTYRVIDLQGYHVPLCEIENVPGEGNFFFITENWDQYGVAQINEHFKKQCPGWRRILDTIYKWRYHVAAGIATAAVGAYIYQHHASFVSKRFKEMRAVTEQLNEQKKASRLLKVIIESVNDKQGLARMSADKMREVSAARIGIKAVDNECRRLAALMPSSWTLPDSLLAAIRIKFGVITGIVAGTYLADVFAKYFLGYRPYVPSCLYERNIIGTESYDLAPYFEQGMNSDFNALVPHYDEATERTYKRNQKITAAVAILAGVYGLYKWSTAKA
jgi:hypothetical protein